MVNYCPDCHGAGADAAKTKAEYRRGSMSGGGHIMCHSCNGNGLYPAAYFRWGNHPPLKGHT